MQHQGVRFPRSHNEIKWPTSPPELKQPRTRPAPTHVPSLLNPRSARRPLILPQARQQLPEALLLRARRAAAGPLAAQVHQLRDALPARAAAARVLARGQELVGLAPRLRDRLVLLVVVVLVEVVDGLLGGLDRFFFLLGGCVGAMLEREVPALAPLPVAGRWSAGSLTMR